MKYKNKLQITYLKLMTYIFFQTKKIKKHLNSYEKTGNQIKNKSLSHPTAQPPKSPPSSSLPPTQ